MPTTLLLLALLACPAVAQQAALPVNDKPVLRVEAGGPTSYVTSLAFSPDGNALYAAGWDKVVRVWVRDAQSGRFALDERAVYRVPIGPGLAGAINAMALSDDGAWLAVAGQAVVREAATFRTPGIVLPSETMTDAMRLDEGTIYVFDTRTNESRALRGHRGPVFSLAFAASRPNKPPLLVSAGEEWDSNQRQMLGGARLWNVQQAQQLGGVRLPRPTSSRPGLAVVHLGEAIMQLGVGLAWGDGSFRIWDAERQTLAALSDVQNATQIAYLPQQRRFFSGGLGQLRAWDLLPNRALRAGAPVAFSSGRDAASVWGMKPLAVAPRGPIDHAALVCVQPAAQGQLRFSLKLISLTSGGRQAASEAGLWSMPASTAAQPAIAVAPTGEHLAVSGGPGHEILVYSTAALIRGGGQPQRLRGVGQALPYVAFARKGETWGFVISPRPKARPGELPRELRGDDAVFDVTAGGLSRDLAGWSVSAPAQETWQVELVAAGSTPDRSELVLRDGQRLAQRIAIPAGHQVTDYALLPERGLLALATHVKGQPLLMLYDVPSGSPIRQLTGPGERIGSLSISGDGRLIIAAAEDQTVSMWSLTDVRRANVPAPDSADSQPTTDARDTALQLIPAIDERKPLCTMFVTQAAGGAPGWICWNPFGPFESSDRQVERYLGWHFNLYQPGKPALFSRAQEYRQEYYQPGLLQSLVERGELPAAVVLPPKPAPIMSLRVREHDLLHLADDPADVVVRNNRLALEFRAFPFEPADVEQVTWNSGGQPQPMVWDAQDREWTADLAGLDWARGRRTVRVTLRTREESPQTFTREATLRFQPPAPRITSRLPSDARTVDAAQFAFEAEVLAAEGEMSQTRVVHRHGEQTIAEMDLGQQRQLSAQLELQQGSNLVEVVSRNRDALPGFEEFETARATWLVTYNPSNVPPPTIALETLAPVAGEGEPQIAAQPIELGRPLEVTVPRIRVTGRIDAAEALDTAGITPPPAGQLRPLTGFEPGRTRTVAISEAIDLIPGKQTISVRAKSPNSVLSEQRLVVDYRPPLPSITLVEPNDQAAFYEGEQPPSVLVRAKLAATGDRQPFTTAISVNRQDLPEPPKIDDQGTLTATVPLEPGDNRIEIRLSNTWGQVSSQAVAVRYLQPPTIVEVEQPRVEAEPLTDVLFWVKSPADLPITEATVNGRPVPPESIAREQDRWKITAQAIPLVDGVNELRLQAANGHGPARKASSLKITYQASQPPRITLPEKEQTVSSQRQGIKFAVRSSSPLERVELLRGDEVLYRATDLAKLAPNTEGWIELQAEPETLLRRGVNRLQVLAVNRTAAVKEELLVSYVPGPVRVVIDGVQPAGRSSELIPAVRAPNGSISFPASALEAEVVMHGRVIWPDDADPTLEKEYAGRVWVNGFQQHARVELQARDKPQLERRFQVPLLLNAPLNRVDVKLAGLPVEANDRLQFTIACNRPRSDQRLHLLIVGIGEEDERALTQRALRALQIETNARGELQKAGFSQVGLYRSLTGVVSPAQIFYQLGDICDKVERSARDRTSLYNNVVILYYQGPEFLNRHGRIALATSFADPVRSAIEGDVLTNFVDAAPGAHVLLLDVARLSPIEPSDVTRRLENLAFWEPDAHLGVLRYAWLRGTDTPPDARLLTALERALPQGSRFVEVESEVAKEFAQAHQKYPDALVYDKHLPLSLRNLIVGGIR